MWLTFGSVVLLVIIDQLTKWWASTVLQAAGTLPFLPGILQLTYIVNDGAAFSIFAGKQKMLIIFTALALTVILVLLVLKKYPNNFVRWGLTLILGGGIGNLIDRVLNGIVVDFFEVIYMEYAIYNMADCFIVTGCCCLAVGILFEERIAAWKAKKPNKG